MTYADRLHPLTVFAYYCAILVLTMTATHPVALLPLFVCAVLLRTVQIGVKKTLAGAPIALLLLLTVSAINLFLVHRGAKILFFLYGKPVTLEAGLAGVSSGVMILSVILFCACLSRSLSGDRMLSLFGRRLPRLALLLRMTLGFLPRFHVRYREISDARGALGLTVERNWFAKVRARLSDLSILMTLMLEESMDQADGMRARGYGLPGATRAVTEPRSKKDAILAVCLVLLLVPALWPLFSGRGEWNWYPLDTAALVPDPLLVLSFSFGTVIAVLPIFLEGKETLKWHILRSRI
ncbi:MAG: hypothetical protein J5958_05125 [Clostridia bacterium]|nr:hypothetical protein [Clostridia bacterium]